MATITSKRKRRDAPSTTQKPSKTRRSDESSASEEEDEAQLKAIFQRHFEAQFKPLPEIGKKPVVVEEIEDEEEEKEEEWAGLASEDEKVEVFEYSGAAKVESGERDALAEKRDLKVFLSGKVPRASLPIPSTTTAATAKAPKEDAEDESLNLKNDLALQRLLSESHLLDPTSTRSLDPSGKNRLRALDLRMQSLGAKESTFSGGKMGMKLRKGISTKRTTVEGKRRKDAKENGIILEKEVREAGKEKKRERGVGGASVGRYKQGMLVLSKRDVRSIEMSGPREGRVGKKKGRR